MSDQLLQQQNQQIESARVANEHKSKQQGGTNIDILKNSVFSSLLPLELPLMDILLAKSSDVMPSLLNNSKFYGISSAMSPRKPTSFFLSIFGPVIDLDHFIEKLKQQQEKDKFGHDYQEQQQHANEHNPMGSDQHAQQHQEQQQQQHNQHEDGSHNQRQQQQQGPSEIDKYKEMHENQQRMNHQNHNHNNHYDAHQFWKHQDEITQMISRKHEDHFRALKHAQQMDDQEYQKEHNKKRR